MTDSYDTLDSDYSTGSGLQISSQDGANLRKAGKWARFVGLFGMVVMGISVFSVVAFGSTMLALAGFSDAPLGGGVVVIFVILFYGGILAFTFYLIYLQYRFGSKAMDAVDRGDGTALSDSFAALARLYKIIGVMLAIYLAFIAFWFAIFVLGGAAAMFSS